MADLAELAFEAMCSALYNMDFSRFLGERPDPVDGSNVAWFLLEDDAKATVRQDPKKVRVAVRQHPILKGVVEVRAEWINLSGPTYMMGEQTFHIPTLLKEQRETVEATTEVVLKLLSIYADVRAGEGVAGPIDKVMPESEAGDPDDPDDMAVPE